jgi:hypothetical protein
VVEVRVRPGAFKEHGDHYKPFGSARGGWKPWNMLGFSNEDRGLLFN